MSKLVAELARGLHPDLAVEAGCFRGDTSWRIGLALEENHHGELYALDTDANAIRSAELRCVALPVHVVLTDARTWIPPAPIDFLFIDSGEPPARIIDLRHFAEYMSPRGLIVIHDTGHQTTLRQAVRKWAEEHRWQLIYLPTPRGLALLRPLGFQ